MMQSLYHSGVGWVNDILSVRLFFDADLEAASAIPHTVTDAATGETAVVHHRPLFAGGAPVRGFARVTAPPGRTVPHHGVTVRLDSGLFALDEINTRDLYSEEVTVAQPGDVTGTVDLPFEFRGTGPHALAESFEGSLFSIRHTATATVLRPWYTFHVAASAPFAVQRVHDIHRPYSEGGEGGEAGAAARGVDAQLALYGPQTLALDAFPADGGDCVLEFDKGWCVQGRGAGFGVRDEGRERGGNGVAHGWWREACCGWTLSSFVRFGDLTWYPRPLTPPTP